MMSDLEIWRPIAGYEGRYEVSSHGQVRSLRRKITQSRCDGISSERYVPARVLKQGRAGADGRYRSVTLFKDGKSRNLVVHVLVCAAFNGARPYPKAEVCHRDDDAENSHYSNLYWGNRQDQRRDQILNGFARLSGLSRPQVDELLANLREANPFLPPCG